MKHLVLLHKTPASWNKKETLDGLQINDEKGEVFPELTMSDGLASMLQDDVYINICESLGQAAGFDMVHIVQGYEPEEPRNWFVEEQAGRCLVKPNLMYWCLDHPSQFGFLPKTTCVFSRGKYHRLHTHLRQHTPFAGDLIWYHYNATAAHFPHLERYQHHAHQALAEGARSLDKIRVNLLGMGVEHDLTISGTRWESISGADIDRLVNKLQTARRKAQTTPYDVLLVDDPSSVNEVQAMYPGVLMLPFVKPSVPNHNANNTLRSYDLMFCGTTLQPTKNHMQFLELLNGLDNLTTESISVAVVGNQGNMFAFDEGLKKPFENIKLYDLGEVSRAELHHTFTQSRVLVVLSGRDANPRVIQEAGMAGTRVLVADTLSDGWQVLANNRALGAVINTNKATWFFQRNGNVFFHADASFAKKVLNELNFSFHPLLTSRVANTTYSLDKVVALLAEHIALINLLED